MCKGVTGAISLRALYIRNDINAFVMLPNAHLGVRGIPKATP